MSGGRGLNDLLRGLAPQVLAALVRRYGAFGAAEDAVQEALATAATQWPRDGVPAQPRGWLITVATRRLIEQFRSDAARRRRELRAWRLDPTPVEVADRDDTLRLLLLCCHRSLRRPAQVALTLRAVGGLTTAEIARAYLKARQLRTWVAPVREGAPSHAPRGAEHTGHSPMRYRPVGCANRCNAGQSRVARESSHAPRQ